jgi:hypothetical protein
MNEDNEELCDQDSSPDIIWMIKKNIEEMDSQGMWHVWETGEVLTGFWWEDLMETSPLEVVDVDGRVLLKLIFVKSDGGMDWIDLARNRDRWRAVVKAVVNF